MLKKGENSIPLLLRGRIFNKAIPVRHGNIVYDEEYVFLALESDQI